MISEILKVLMEITLCKLMFIKELAKNAKDVRILFREKKLLEEVHIGAVIARNKKRTYKVDPFKYFYLALSYFLKGLPPKYLRRLCISQPSSRWIGVVLHRHEHQDSMNLENCIENNIKSIKRVYLVKPSIY